jgi:NAD-dependent deacetylase
MTTSRDIINLRELVGSAQNMVILTGAGISTESGVPDFRSPGGLWEKFRIVEYNEYVESEDARIEDWHRRFYMADQIETVEPNIGHHTIAQWLNEGKASCLVTQNVDGLHLKAGAPEERTIEIHGNATTTSCIDCHSHHEMTLCRQMFEKTGASPKCRSCGGIIKANVVMFGEAMPRDKTARAFEQSEQADLFLAIGTSLVVHPAAALPLHAKHAGAKLAIINRDPTQVDSYADCVVNAEIGEVMRALSS